MDAPHRERRGGRDKSGVIHVALTNVDPNRSASAAVELKGATPKQVSGRS